MRLRLRALPVTMDIGDGADAGPPVVPLPALPVTTLRPAVIALYAAGVVASTAASPTAGRAQQDSAAIAVVAPDPATDFGRGARLGLEEAQRSVELLRSPLRLLELQAPAEERVEDWVRDAAAQGVVGLVVALPDAVQRQVEEVAAGAGMVVVDARARRPAAAERDLVVRTGLPEEAFRGARQTAAAAAGDPRVVLWAPGLFRYGAQQLNERYRRRFDAGMTGEAWAGWMAVKALSEAALRWVGRPGSGALVDGLRGRRALFDGHKGVSLTFTGPGGTLAQPVYVMDENVVEVQWPEEEQGG